MQPSPPARITISLIALLAMAWVHVVQPARGFECDCGDTPVFTVQEHCHGPHSEACHEHDDAAPHHDHDDLPADDDTHHHTALIESLLALKADSSQLASIAAVTPLALPAITLPPVVINDAAAPRSIVAHADDRRWPRILAHAIALRV